MVVPGAGLRRWSTLGAGRATAPGWAIPTATDIAFALAVLAVISTHLPAALRTFLLTLAVVDDLLAITIIAVFYTAHAAAAAAARWRCVPLALFAVLVQRRVRSWWLLLPLAAATWALVHASGRARHRRRGAAGVHRPGGPQRAAAGPGPGLAEHFEHRFRPLSAGFAVPVFAFFAAGVAVGGAGTDLTDPVTAGIVVGLVVGKPVGMLAATWLVHGSPGPSWTTTCWWDVVGLALLGGIGFTVSLLIGELAFGPGARRRPRQGRRPGRIGRVGAARDRRCCASATGTTGRPERLITSGATGTRHEPPDVTGGEWAR